MISHPHRCIFVHIPKTAGNSVNRVFGIGWQDHKDLQRYRYEESPDVFAAYFKFAIVRNPWDRLLSDYNYQLKKSRPRDSKLFVFTAGGTKRGFAEWVEAALLSPTAYEANAWGGSVSAHIHRWSPQVDWITVDGRIAVDFIAKLERLPVDFRVVCDRVGLSPTRLPHRNRRLHWHYSHYYDRSTQEIVANYYARDIEEFGYEFEDSLLRLAWPFKSPSTPPPTRELEERESINVASPRPVSWLSRAPLALAASLALLLSAWTVSPLAAFSAAEPDLQPEVRAASHLPRAVAQSVLRPLPRSAREAPATRVMRTLRGLANYRIVAAPSPTLPFMLVPAVEGGTSEGVARRTRPRLTNFPGARAEDTLGDDTPRPRLRLNLLNQFDR